MNLRLSLECKHFIVQGTLHSEVTLFVAHLKPAERLKNVKPSVKRRFLAQARQMPEVTNLGIDEPDFAPPKHILNTAEKAVTGRKTHYTPTNGIPNLRKALAQKANSEYGLTYDLNPRYLSLLVKLKRFSWR